MEVAYPTLNKIHVGDCVEVMKTWPSDFVQTVVTSPPYWGLRDYGVEGQIGLEGSPEEFVEKMVEVFREVRRILRSDGTLWLNLGDSYAGSAQGWGHDKQYAGPKQSTNRGSLNQPEAMKNKTGFKKPANYISSRQKNGLKPKDLVGIPWRVALALQFDGWYLRSDIIWSKPNPMPESVTDRPTKAHEYLFLMTKSERYFYDADAIREPAIYRIDERPFGDAGGNRYGDEGRPYKPNKSQIFSKDHPERAVRSKYKTPSGWDTGPGSHDGKIGRYSQNKINGDRNDNFEHPSGGWSTMDRNKRTVWTVPTWPFSEAHFATFPPDLIKPCILAGSMGGGIVLDPFLGAGTTALVALQYNRNFLGIELNPEYAAMAEARISTEKAQLKFI